jgi:hypothetical protein
VYSFCIEVVHIETVWHTTLTVVHLNDVTIMLILCSINGPCTTSDVVYVRNALAANMCMTCDYIQRATVATTFRRAHEAYVYVL